MTLEVMGKIEDGTGKNFAFGEQKGDEQPADTPVTVEEGWMVSNWAWASPTLTNTGRPSLA